jgi:pilus assembly protein Flp/PilA
MKLGNRESGQGLVEYALIIVLLALALIVALVFFSDGIGNVFSNIVSRL